MRLKQEAWVRFDTFKCTKHNGDGRCLPNKTWMILFSKVTSTTTVLRSIYGYSYTDVKMLYTTQKIFPLQVLDGRAD